MQRPLRRGIIVLVASIVAAAAAPAAAQPDSHGGGKLDPSNLDPSTVAPASPYAGMPSHLVDIDFPGGTLAEFIESLRQAAEVPVNTMIADASVLAHPVPALDFRDVSLTNALEALEWAAGGDDASLRVVVQSGEIGEPIYSIYRQKRPVARQVTPSPPSFEVRVFMIRDIIEPPPGRPADPTTVIAADSLITAVDAVLASVPEYAEKPTVLFHPESATLIVTAPVEQLNAIQEMLRDLQMDIEERSSRALAAADRVDDAEQRLRQTVVQFRATEVQIEATQAMVEELQSRAELLEKQPGVSQMDLQAAVRDMRAAMDQLAQLQAQLKIKQIEHDAAESDLEAVRQGVAQPPAAAEPIAANYHDPVVLRARPEIMAMIEAIRHAAPARGLPTINTNTDEGLTVTATAPQHAILHAAVEAMKAVAGETGGAGGAGRPGEPSRPAKNHRE